MPQAAAQRGSRPSAPRRRAPSRWWTRAGASRASAPPRPPGTAATTTSGSRSSPTPPASPSRSICCGSSSSPSSSRASWPSRAPSSTAISDDGYLTEPLEEIAGTLRPEIECDAAEVESGAGGRAGPRPARRRRALRRRMYRAATAAARSGDPGFNTAIQIARHHLELVAEREHSLLRRELRATDEEIACALALVRSCHPRPGPPSARARPSTSSPMSSCGAPTTAGPSRSMRPRCRACA